MKVALVYDRVNKWGGAERLLLSLHQLFPDAPLYTSVYNPKKAPWASVFLIKTSFLQNLPFASFSHEYFATLMPLAFESFSFDEYDLVISVTSEAAKGIITKPHTFHLCYCLTPTRYLWSSYEEYFEQSLLKVLAKPVVAYLRYWDLAASSRPDAYVAISKEVKARIKKYYKKDSEVLYPPVTLSETAGKELNKKNDAPPSGYFLVVSRLVAYKRIEIVINACNQLKLPLVIVGSGAMELKLRSIAGRTIFFTGNLTDDQLVGYYKNCLALVFPGVEDFGLTVLEAQLFGKPVIAFRGGGAVETILEGKTGEFFYPQTTDALVSVLKKYNASSYQTKHLKAQASRFSTSTFQDEFKKLLEKHGFHL